MATGSPPTSRCRPTSSPSSTTSPRRRDCWGSALGSSSSSTPAWAEAAPTPTTGSSRRRSRRAPGEGPDRDHGRLVAPRLLRRARAPVGQGADSRVRVRARVRRRRRSRAATPAPRQLRRRPGALPDTWFTMVRPGIAIYGVSPFADGTSPVPLTPAMTLRGHRLPWSSMSTRDKASPTDTPTSPTATPRSGWSRSGYGDGVPRHASNAGPGRRSAGVASRSPVGSAWTSSSSTSASFEPAAGTTGRACSAAPTAVSPPPMTGPRPPARSATRS